MRWLRRSASGGADGDAADAGPTADAIDAPPAHDHSPPAGEVQLGDLLREARLERALTLAEVERDTRINREYLAALEQEQYEVLPAPVYTRGFVRSYARHLGLEADEALALLPDDLPRPQGLEPIAGLRRGGRGGRTRLPAFNGPLAAIVGAAIIAAAALVAATVLLNGGGDAASPEVAPASPTTAATVQPAAGASEDVATPAATVPPFAVGETPDFLGVRRDVAQALLRQLGLQFVVIEVATAEAPAGQVFGQTPDPGAPIEAGDDVTLIVSAGPPGGSSP